MDRAAANKVTPRRRGRRTFREAFLTDLARLGATPDVAVNSQNLRNRLEWDQKRFARVRSELVADGLIINQVGGPGGSITLPTRSAEAAHVSLFISYSHKDKSYHDLLVQHLRPLKRKGLISSWSDQQLLAGDTWDTKIQGQLETADIIVLLISIDFINSEYCYDRELNRALERHSSKKCRVVPILVRSCLWQDTDFQILQAIPTHPDSGPLPVAMWKNLDDAMTRVVSELELVARDIIKDRVFKAA